MSYEFTCDRCGKTIIGKPYYSNHISYDDDTAYYDICSADCLLHFLADKIFNILNKRE